MDETHADEQLATQDGLRHELPYDGLVDWVCLSQVNARVHKFYPTIPLAERQRLTMDAVRSLVSEGLFELGDLDTREDGRFAAFTEPLDISMQRIHDAYVTHHSDGLGWVYRFWLNLTDKGIAAATATEEGREIARQVIEDTGRLRNDP